ncbi:MAG: hypothetical protein ABIR32_21080, partial [Ilumatobacteraceae bacterium]
MLADETTGVGRRANKPSPEVNGSVATWSFGRYGDVVAWIAIAAVALVVLDAQHVPTTFFFDEWSFI